MKVAIVDYKAGNVCSVQFALERLGIEPFITDDADELLSADKVIFPGVGSAGAAMKNLAVKGLDRLIPLLKQPVLGICLGMQLFAETSEEDDVACLGIVPGRVLKFRGEKVPHMGWNLVSGQPPLQLPSRDPFFYYVHSYYIPEGGFTTATTDYGVRFSAMVRRNNFYGVQFHPEKSGKAGEELIKSFLSI